MDAADFVLGTLSHTIRRAEGPPPGIPAHAGAAFETRFAALCVDQRVTPAVTRSLDRLVLPPTVSRVTVARLAAHAEATLEEASRRLRVLVRVVEAFAHAGVPALVMGDALSAATLYGREPTRAVARLELLVREGDVRAALATAAKEGFARRGVHPVLGAGDEATSTAGHTEKMEPALARDVLSFHHYMSPLILTNDDGDRLSLRFRVVRLGHPGVDERAWERARTIDVARTQLCAVSLDDHLFDTLLRIGTSGYTDINAIADAGLIVARHADGIHWERVAERARMHGLYAALHHVLAHVGRALDMNAPESRLGEHSGLVEKWLDLFWQPASIDYTGGPDRDLRFLYGLAACGGFFTKLDWARHAWIPRPTWVTRITGDASSPMNWLEFVMTTRQENRDALAIGPAPVPVTHSNVRRFQRRKP